VRTAHTTTHGPSEPARRTSLRREREDASDRAGVNAVIATSRSLYAAAAAPALLLVLVLGVEAAVRLALFGPEAVVTPWRFTNHFPMAAGLLEIEESDFRLRANLDLFYKGARFSTNEHGFRGHSISVERPEGTFRIAVLGRSNTMGHGVGNTEVWTAQLEAKLDQRLSEWQASETRAAASGAKIRGFEVMNLGVSGHNVPAMLRAYDRWWARFEPNAILLEAYATDLEPQARLTLARDATAPSVQNVLDYFFLSVIARRLAAEAGLGRFAEVPAVERRGPTTPPVLDDSRALLDEFVAKRRAEGIPVLLVRLARPGRLARGFGPGSDTLAMRDWEDAHIGSAWLDTASWVEGRAAATDRVFYGDDHPNARVHALYADALQSLLERTLLARQTRSLAHTAGGGS
jgi:hypothetical protein